MKIVTALLNPDEVPTAVRHLTNNGFSYDDISLMSASSQIPDFLGGDAEDSALSGAAVGAATGGTAGALGAVVASTIPGFEMMFVSGLMATAVGSVIGGYLGSLYSVRAENQTEMNIHEALADGQLLLVVKGENEVEIETAVAQLSNANGQHIETHTIADAENPTM